MGTVRAAIGLGSNLGDRARHLFSAVASIVALPDTSILRLSSARETEPVGNPDQPRFLNAAVTIRTGLPPAALLTALLEIEQAHARVRVPGARWGPRTLDLDLLLFGEEIVRLPGLTLPHPRLHERAFVLDPLAEIAPDWMVPGRGVSVAQARAALGASVS